MKNTYKIALCGLISSFALVLMLIANIFPIGTYTIPCLCGMLLVSVVIEFGAKYAYIPYVAISLISLFLVSDKEAVLYFIAFFGFYPILKSTIEKIKLKSIQYLVKYTVFNLCMVIAFFIGKFIFMIPDEGFVIFGVYVPWVFLIIGNFVFLLYDIAVSRIVVYYLFKIRNKIFNK